MRLPAILLLSVTTLFAQGQAVNQSQAPPPDNYVSQYFYSGSNLTYECRAAAYQPVATFYKSSSTLTQIVVSSTIPTVTFSSTSYLWVGATVTVAGSATSGLNATYRVTAVSGSTATLTATTAADATYTDAGLTLSTSSPLLNSAVWGIHAYKYDGSNNLIGAFWAGTPTTAIPMGLACSNRANY